jgi:Family of unknown function (DUF5996)
MTSDTDLQNPVQENPAPTRGEYPASGDRWPELRVSEWSATRDTLQLWTQIVGKVRLVNEPIVNHWWNVPLYVTSRGLTTSLISHPSGLGFEIEFDFLAGRLDITTSSGGRQAMNLEPGPIAAFHAQLMGLLDDLGVPTQIWPVPVEIPGAIAFPDDTVRSEYDADQARLFWLLLVQIVRVFTQFRARFLGKASPVHLFWGALDLATTRFSGRLAPPYSREVPNCGPQVMLEAYSHEVSSCGYWPGGEGEGVFYSYAYPEPEGFRDAVVRPEGARFYIELGEFVLPYELVRKASDPDGILLEFLQSTYEAAASAAAWDRAALERRESRT